MFMYLCACTGRTWHLFLLIHHVFTGSCAHTCARIVAYLFGGICKVVICSYIFQITTYMTCIAWSCDRLRKTSFRTVSYVAADSWFANGSGRDERTVPLAQGGNQFGLLSARRNGMGELEFFSPKKWLLRLFWNSENLRKTIMGESEFQNAGHSESTLSHLHT